jgi:HEAT repeat protein
LVGLGTLKTQAADAEPAIRQALADSSGAVRVAAAAALGKQDRHAAGLPVLIECLADTNDWVRHAAMQALDDYGPHAANARPQVQKALEDTNQYVGRIAQHFLEQQKAGE